jgi:hypothetical protein
MRSHARSVLDDASGEDVVLEEVRRGVCATPGCHAGSGHGRTTLFCEPCAERLGHVRTACEDRTTRRYRIYGTASGFVDRKRKAA